jgi:hypothetical protein
MVAFHSRFFVLSIFFGFAIRFPALKKGWLKFAQKPETGCHSQFQALPLVKSYIAYRATYKAPVSF